MSTLPRIDTARKPRSRAYASPVPREEVAQRIADSIRLHADQGITRQPEQYTCSPQTLALVAAILASDACIHSWVDCWIDPWTRRPAHPFSSCRREACPAGYVRGMRCTVGACDAVEVRA